MANDDPLVKFKAMQRESWGLFAPLAIFTTPAAAYLVDWAGVKSGETVLDVASGTGVVAVTAARKGARVKGMDLSPVLLGVNLSPTQWLHEREHLTTMEKLLLQYLKIADARPG